MARLRAGQRPTRLFSARAISLAGAMAVRNAIKRKERAEDESRPVAWYDKQLAKLADAAGKADK